MRAMRIKLAVILSVTSVSISCGAAGTQPVKSEQALYLSIISTQPEGMEFIPKYQQLQGEFQSMQVIKSSHCSNLKPGLILITSEYGPDKPKVTKALSTAKKKVPDSYLRECHVVSGTTLAYGLPTFDSSIQKLPESVINWSYTDTVSSVFNVDDGHAIYVQKIFNGDVENEAEGRQTRLNLFNVKTGKTSLMMDQCWDFSGLKVNGDFLTFQCMTAMAGNQYIHTSYVYDQGDSKMVFQKEYCQQPDIAQVKQLKCLHESINDKGELELEKQTFSY